MNKNNAHLRSVIARKIKFIFEKQSFINFAFDTHKGKNQKEVRSLFRSKDKLYRQKLYVFLCRHFKIVITELSYRANSRFDQSNYDEYYNNLLRKLSKGLIANKFLKDMNYSNSYLFWSYLTKVTNIILYELLSNHELVSSKTFKFLFRVIHSPIDKKVIDELKKRIRKLKIKDEDRTRCVKSVRFYRNLMSIKSKDEYYDIQNLIRYVQKKRKELPIYIEDAYSK